MKKFLKWTLIVVGVLIVLLLTGIIALPFVFPLEKIKDFAVGKISETIRREVKIEKVSFDLFSGIKLRGLYVGNRAGFAKKPFVSADMIELHYAFWPLFSRQVIIKEIRLVKPEILIEKNVRGEFNFSDLLKTKDDRRKTMDDTRIATDKRKTKPPFDLFVTSFSVKDGRITYSDYSTRTTNEIKNLNLKVSGFELALVKPIDIKVSANVTYQGKEIPLALTGKVGVNLAKETLTVPSLSLSIAGESIAASASVSNWKVAPKIDFSVSSKKINVDPLLAVFAAAPTPKVEKPKPGELTKTINRAVASIPRTLGFNGSIKIENLTFQKFKVDKVDLGLALSNKIASANIKEIRIYDGALSGKARVELNVPGLSYTVENLKLSGFNAHPFSNAVVETFLTNLPDYKDLINKVYGTLDASASLKARGVEPQDILANVAGEGSLVLKKGELKRLKTLAEVGKMIKSNSLQRDIKFGELTTAFGMRSRVVDVKNLRLEEPEFKINFKGGIDLGKLTWVAGNRLTLKLSPQVTSGLAKEFVIFRDDKDWLELTFEITGSLKVPIPKPILEKPLEAALGKIKAKIEAKKIEFEEKAKAELATKEAEAKKALEEEAKKKLKEMIKF